MSILDTIADILTFRARAMAIAGRYDDGVITAAECNAAVADLLLAPAPKPRRAMPAALAVAA